MTPTTSAGVRLNSWIDLCRESDDLPVFDRTKEAEQDLDPRCVVPPGVGVEDLGKLINGRSSPITIIEHFRLGSPEDAFAGCVVRRISFAGSR